MRTIKASDFKYRSDLENEVRNKYGLTPEPKEDIVIEGSREDLHRLQLSDRTVFWGITCVINVPKEKTKPKVANDVDRGERSDFGIGKKTKKIK